MIHLDPRLQKIADFVPPGTKTADIGTDHGLLISYLVQQKTIPYGVAADVNPKPLGQAAKTIEREGLSSCIELVLSDGFRELKEKQIETFVLAGMGGELISRLIKESPWVYNPSYNLVLQPMTRSEPLRFFLAENGFLVQKESAIVSNKFAYSVMLCTFTGLKKNVTIRDSFVGELWPQSDMDTEEYFSQLYFRLSKKIRSVPQDDLNYPEYQQLLQDLKERISR